MSSFFEPVPPREPPPPRVWGRPAWDRPSEGTLPAIFPIEEIVGRLGVRFADGRTAGSEGGVITNVDKDENGFPTQPVLRMTGGGGGSRGFRYGVWVHPLPPDGPMEIFVAATGSEERRVVVDGAAVRVTADRAKVIWT